MNRKTCSLAREPKRKLRERKSASSNSQNSNILLDLPVVDKRHTIRYIYHVKQFKWNSTKNAWLKKNRGISFEDILLDIQNGKLLDKVETPNPEKYPDQKIYVVDHDGYCMLVPHIEIDDVIFLKTLFPSRVATKIYKAMLTAAKRPTLQRLSLSDKKGGKGD